MSTGLRKIIHWLLRLIIVMIACAHVDGCSQSREPQSDKDKQPTDVYGILPFDTNSKNLVFRSSLTSPSSITVVGGEEELGAQNEFDSMLGMIPKAPAGLTPGCRFRAKSIPGLSDLPSGQISIEVERAWLGTTDPEMRSGGSPHPEIEHLLSFGPAAGDTASAGRVYMQSNQSMVWMLKAAETFRVAHFVNTYRSDRFARIALSWTPTQAQFFIDGLLVSTVDRVDQGGDRFLNIFLGSFVGTNLWGFQSPFYVRNLVVANIPVEFRVPALLDHVMQLGDSFSGGPPLANNPPQYDGTISNTIIGALAQRGIGYGKFTVYSHGGGNIQDNGPRPLETDVNGSGKSRAQALMENPTLIVFITGGNDAGIFDAPIFTTDLHDHIEAFLGVAGYPPTTVRHVVVTTTTSNLAASSPVILAMGDIMRALPVWWDSTYPNRAGSVSVVDTWKIFGSETVDHLLFSISDTVHPAASGNIVYGRAITDRILSLVQ